MQSCWHSLESRECLCVWVCVYVLKVETQVGIKDQFLREHSPRRPGLMFPGSTSPLQLCLWHPWVTNKIFQNHVAKVVLQALQALQGGNGGYLSLWLNPLIHSVTRGVERRGGVAWGAAENSSPPVLRPWGSRASLFQDQNYLRET